MSMFDLECLPFLLSHFDKHSQVSYRDLTRLNEISRDSQPTDDLLFVPPQVGSPDLSQFSADLHPASANSFVVKHFN
jgi:hypothetical protein